MSISLTTLANLAAGPQPVSIIDANFNAIVAALAAADGASNITFGNSGIGAVPTDLQTRGRKVLYVTDYGATGDGITDDAANIQKALTAASGRIVFFPAGTYVIGTTLLIPSNSILCGDGWATSLQKKVGSAIGIMQNIDANGSGTGTQDSNIIVREMKLVGEATATTQFCVRMENVTNFQIRNVWTQNTLNGDSAAIDINGCQFFIVDGCYVANTTNNGIKVRCAAEASTDFIISNNVVTTTASQNGIFVANSASFGATRFTIVGNSVASCGDIGIEVGNTGAANHSNFTIISNSVYDSGGCNILVRESTGWSVSGNSTLKGGSASSDGSISVLASAVDTTDGVISGNQVGATDAGAGVRLGFASTFRARRIAITGNSVKSAAYNGIELNGGNEFTITGNVIDTTGRMGIELVDAVEAVNRAVITNNSCIGATFDGLNCAGATNSVIALNNCSSNGRYGIRFSAGATGNILGDNITQSNVTAAYNGIQQSFTAVGNTITPVCSLLKFDSNGSYTLTSVPTLADGYDGQKVTLLNIDTVDVIAIQDQGTLAGSNLRLSATAIALGPRDSITLQYSSDIGDWVQIAQTNVL